MSKCVLVLAMAAVVVVGLGCSQPAAKTAVLSEKETRTTIELRVGDQLDVALAGNPTTGYMWEVVAFDAAVLRQVGEARFTAASAAIGAGGTVKTTFEALGAGKTPLKMVYRRSFEKGVPPIKTFEATVVVKAK